MEQEELYFSSSILKAVVGAILCKMAGSSWIKDRMPPLPSRGIKVTYCDQNTCLFSFFYKSMMGKNASFPKKAI